MNKEKRLDEEWIRLILMAKQMGLSYEEVRTYLQQTSPSEEKTPTIHVKPLP